MIHFSFFRIRQFSVAEYIILCCYYLILFIRKVFHFSLDYYTRDNRYYLSCLKLLKHRNVTALERLWQKKHLIIFCIKANKFHLSKYYEIPRKTIIEFPGTIASIEVIT